MEQWQDWEDVIEELDAGAFEVTHAEVDFLASLLERKPRVLSARQVAWLEDMRRKYLAY